MVAIVCNVKIGSRVSIHFEYAPFYTISYVSLIVIGSVANSIKNIMSS